MYLLVTQRPWSLQVQHPGKSGCVQAPLLFTIIFRILLRIQKFVLPDEDVQLPIPTLSDRQFVVSKSGLSAEQERLQRELFWYREALLKYVRGRWKEVRRPQPFRVITLIIDRLVARVRASYRFDS